ncbi:Golgi integral membrane protein 4 [Myotis brandtii]|uniref:Golgi integral membrane protein 4 n=1 Tax=Myotis brandtii TaxID=109478 RepID=S7MRG0_MYOBR|nr:Golgi integral membrane protein 4 [Myotis brandtii]
MQAKEAFSPTVRPPTLQTQPHRALSATTQPGHVPLTGIKPVTLQSADALSTEPNQLGLHRFLESGKEKERNSDVSRNSDSWQDHGAVAGRTEETKQDPPSQKEAELQAAELHQPQAEAREPEGHQVEEEQRKALEEEAMEQVGQAERLEEEHDPSPEEQDREWKEQREQREDGREGHAHAELRGNQ